MPPQIKTLQPKKLIGKKLKMSMVNNQTGILWQSFMPRRKEIKNNVNSDLLSMQIYEQDHDFQRFNPNKTFDKWATVEVGDFENVPDGMETFILEGGLYAVFQYKGDPRNGAVFFQNIFQNWLPNSGYMLDKRPHFEVLGEKYKNNDPDSEEEVWIPIKTKLI